MEKYEFDNEYGKYSLHVERAKKRTNGVIRECYDEGNIISHLQKLTSEYECLEAFVTYLDDNYKDKEGYLYTIDSYELDKLERKDTPDYNLIPVTIENASIYQDIYNEATFNIDNMSTCDKQEIQEYLENEEAIIGLIQYQGKIIGTYTTMGKHEVDSFAISKEYRGKHLARGALQCVLNTMEDHAILFVSTRNIPALNLYKSMGFKQGQYITKFYKISSPISL